MMNRFNPRLLSNSNVYIQRFLSSEKMVPNQWDPLLFEEAVKKYNKIKGRVDPQTRNKLESLLKDAKLQASYDDNADRKAKAAMSKKIDRSATAKVEEAQKAFATMVTELQSN